jgi:hypothetical protein
VQKPTLVTLKRLYEQIAKIHLNSNLYSWDCDLSRDFDQKLLNEVLNSVKQTSENTFEAESAWAAAIFLVERQARQGFLTGVAPLAGEVLKTQNFKIVFRGQNAKYAENIHPTEWRHQNAIPGRQKIAPERLHNWQGAFCLLLKCITEADANLSIQSSMYFSAAQHYGIPTDFLDWTVDPCVAVWFAHPEQKAERSGEGIVFFTNLELQEKMELILPPPFVHRLYRQRGLFNFTESQEANASLHQQSCKITFPFDKEFSLPRALHLSGQQILAVDPFLCDLVREAHAIASDPDLPNDYFDFLRQTDFSKERLNDSIEMLSFRTSALANKFPFSEKRWERIKADWLLLVERYIGWLCMFDSSCGKHLTSGESMLRLIERNRDALFVYAHSIMSSGRAERLGERSGFIKLLYERLLCRYPELEDTATSYSVPLIVGDGRLTIIKPSLALR